MYQSHDIGLLISVFHIGLVIASYVVLAGDEGFTGSVETYPRFSPLLKEKRKRSNSVPRPPGNQKVKRQQKDASIFPIIQR